MVRTAKVTPEQLAALLRQSATTTPNPAALGAASPSKAKAGAAMPAHSATDTSNAPSFLIIICIDLLLKSCTHVAKEKERRIKLNNRIEILERRIQEEDSAEVNEMVTPAMRPVS